MASVIYFIFVQDEWSMMVAISDRSPSKYKGNFGGRITAAYSPLAWWCSEKEIPEIETRQLLFTWDAIIRYERTGDSKVSLRIFHLCVDSNFLRFRYQLVEQSTDAREKPNSLVLRQNKKINIRRLSCIGEYLFGNERYTVSVTAILKENSGQSSHVWNITSMSSNPVVKVHGAGYGDKDK